MCIIKIVDIFNKQHFFIKYLQMLGVVANFNKLKAN